MAQNAKQIMEEILAGKDVSKAISEAANACGKKKPTKKVAGKKAVKVAPKMESRTSTCGKKRVRKLFEECEKVDSIICPVCGGENVDTRYNADTDESCFVCADCGNAYVLADATAFDLEEPITAENTDSIATVNEDGEVEVKVAEDAADATDVTTEDVPQVEGTDDLEGEFVEPVEGEVTPEVAVTEPEEDDTEAAPVNPDNWDDEGNFIGDPAEYDGEVVDYPYPNPILPEDTEYSEGYGDDEYTGEDDEYTEGEDGEEGYAVGEPTEVSGEDDEDKEEEEAGDAPITEQKNLRALRAANKKVRRNR